ncbi:uncharacterized protein LOC131153138 isoform X10 [Malania oleifera]|uniref:uncharacterized protein LOC131153138 isoform X10 n=1 Tax=Malania oleifera TaxID=397392 RepID=UPI0025AE1ADD|nr:uncharacterized protein LOC131153138 isoform X10 [Malania oleifera]
MNVMARKKKQIEGHRLTSPLIFWVLLAAQDMGQAEQLRKSGILYLVRRLSIGRRNVHGLNQGSQHFHLLKGKILPLSLPYPVAQENNNLSPQSLIRHLDSLSLLLNLSFP